MNYSSHDCRESERKLMSQYAGNGENAGES